MRLLIADDAGNVHEVADDLELYDLDNALACASLVEDLRLVVERAGE